MATASKSTFAHLRDIDWRQPSVIALVLANLVLIFGVVFLHWEVFSKTQFLFWSENVVVGAFNVLKMLTANPTSPLSWIGRRVFIVPFFCVHYGMFTYIHGIFVVELFGGIGKGQHGFPNAATFWHVMQENQLSWAVLGLAVSHGISFFTNYIGKGEYRRASVQQLMSQPYGRIIVMHFAILFGGFLMMALHSPAVGLAGILLVVGRKPCST